MMSKQEEEINELNTICKATLGVSKISGIGVIALRSLDRGEKLYAGRMPNVFSVPYGSFGKLFPEVRKMILERWPLVMQGERFVYPDARLISFMNHSYHPNYNPETDEMLEDVSVGTEITENYCVVKDAEKIYPWLNCKKDVIIKE